MDYKMKSIGYFHIIFDPPGDACIVMRHPTLAHQTVTLHLVGRFLFWDRRSRYSLFRITRADVKVQNPKLWKVLWAKFKWPWRKYVQFIHWFFIRVPGEENGYEKYLLYSINIILLMSIYALIFVFSQIFWGAIL